MQTVINGLVFCGDFNIHTVQNPSPTEEKAVFNKKVFLIDRRDNKDN